MPPPTTIITRCSDADIKAVMEFDPTISNLAPFRIAANELVTEICASAGVYSSTRLKSIETWLAAHFLAVRDPRYQSESIGAASATIQSGQMGMNLSLTTYGQQALLMDTQGGLARLNTHISQGKRAKAGILHLGSKRELERWSTFPWRFLGGF